MGHTLQIALPQFQAFMIILLRVGGILAAWPILGTAIIPLQIKTGFVLMLALVLFPIIHLPPLPADPLRWVRAWQVNFLSAWSSAWRFGSYLRGSNWQASSSGVKWD